MKNLIKRGISGTARLLVLAGLLAGVHGLPASAQNINLLPEGQTLLSLAVTERVSVPQDTLLASLRVEIEDRSLQAVQADINARMEEALALVRGRDGLKVTTGNYSVYQTGSGNSGGRTDLRWRGMQTLNLESMDAELVLELAGELQEMGMVMNQLTWSLSQEASDAARNDLLESALSRAREQAERAAAAMGKQDVDLAVVEIDSPMGFDSSLAMRGMTASVMEDARAPSAEAGETEVTLTVRVQAVAQ